MCNKLSRKSFIGVGLFICFKLIVLSKMQFIYERKNKTIDFSYLVKNDDPHDLAFDNNDSSLVVHTDTTWMLQDVGAELANELTILIVNLNLKFKKSFFIPLLGPLIQ